MNKDLLAKFSVIRYLNILEKDSDEDELTIARTLLVHVWGLSKVKIPKVKALNDVVQDSGYESNASISLLQEAKELLEKHQISYAFEKIIEAQEKDPLNPESYLMGAKILMKAQKWKHSVYYLELVTRLNPQLREAYILLSNAYFMCDDLESARAIKKKAKENIPDIVFRATPEEMMDNFPGLQERNHAFIEFLSQGDNFARIKQTMSRLEEAGVSLDQIRRDPEMQAFIQEFNSFCDNNLQL